MLRRPTGIYIKAANSGTPRLDVIFIYHSELILYVPAIASACVENDWEACM